MTLHVSSLQAQRWHGLIKYIIDDGVAPGTWTVVEPMVGIVGVSLPLMTPIFRKIKEVSTQKSSEGSIEGGWYHTRLGSGQRKADIPLANHEEWTDHDPTFPANPSFVTGTELQDPVTQCRDTDPKSVV
jgi:hypothetical protein